MEKRVLLVCIVVGFLGVLAATLGFAAEVERIKVAQVHVANGLCSYPRTPAMALGLTASVALMIAQVIINVAAGCICCKRNPSPSSSNWTLALVCFVVSWFTFVIAFLLLLTGAALNDQHGEETLYFGSFCYVVKPGVFAGGAVLSVASVALGIIYYITLMSAKNSADPSGGTGYPSQEGIAIGHPRFPQSSTQDPVFVHEDTYNRRQFP